MWARRYSSQIQFMLLSTFVLAVPFAPHQTFAQETGVGTVVEKSARERDLREQLQNILHELEELQQQPASGAVVAPVQPAQPAVAEESSDPASAEAIPQYELSDVSIVSNRVQRRPEGLSVSSTEQSETESQPTRTMKESMESLPGVVLRQANGPRDFSMMIRGQGAKTTFAVRDIKMYEDGFIQTQSDGLSRLDIHDPWFMRSVEVIRGASSSLYDNYALGGMVHFRTRRGSDINGVETFLSGGSFGYHKEGIAVGQEYENLDASLFVSNVGEDGFIRNSNYSTQTINLNLRFKIDDKQNFYFKAITNWLDARVPTRLTQSQFNADRRQAGGTNVVCNANTCSDAERLAQRRLDRRTIIGGIYERQINANTVLTIEADYDVKDINQTFSQISDNVNPNYKHYADLRHDGRLFDMPLRSYVGFFLSNMEQEAATFQNLADGFGTRGALIQNSRGTIRNVGARFREELEVIPKVTLAAGLGFEQSQLSVQSIGYTGGAVSSRAGASRSYTNWAPEMSVTWKPTETQRHWARASTGYGIPGFGNLLRDPVTGAPGTNFDLKPQKNLNFEIGTESKLTKTLTVQLVGFWTFFKDEIITQAVSGTNTASVNADSSQYKGIEAFYDWRPMDGLRLSGAYTHIEAKYINFADRLNTAAGFLTRDGNKVPNVPTDVLNTKVAYDHAETGWGGWVEGSYYNSYFLNNSNTFGIPSYVIANVNIHKNFDLKNSWFRFAKFYIELDNIADKKYAASGQVIGGETAGAAAGQQAFFAGYGRAIYGGVTFGLF
ncbi:MAG: TonB-dependent receptor [Nitrospira sp.]|nr:TonB-dependent receptor [Nitrospira sp.]MBP6604422.1 TonB-dependent receptor [Nitrospira sp.]HQY56400.1 TonB-dependent receptor [Nitrospira sp.]HRA98441.1 TonB-dependent receptor [Nitrospira sp.]